MKVDRELPTLLPTCDQEIVAYGPVLVLRSRKRRKVEKSKLDYTIRYGWSPLLMSTAKCFTHLICSANEPAYAPNIYKLVVSASDVNLYTCSKFPIVFAPDGTTVDYQTTAKENWETEKIAANIFLLDMKKFGETVEMHVTTNMTIFNENVDRIFLKGTGTKLTIHKC